jgi:hypothetical protein
MNQPPVVNAGSDQQTSTCSGCLAPVTLAGSAVDAESDPLQYQWKAGATVIANGATPVVYLGAGTHTLTLAVSDPLHTGTDTVVITVTSTDLGGVAQELATAHAAIAALQTQLATANAQNASLQTQLAAANATIASLNAQIASLQAQLTAGNATNAALTAQMASLQQMLQTAFADPTFTVPGATPQEQLQNLMAAINTLNAGQKLALYNSLGGKKK